MVTPFVRIRASFSASRVVIAWNCRVSVSRAACATAARASSGKAARAVVLQKARLSGEA